jgi:Carboxypeptidase regulatory-like domain
VIIRAHYLLEAHSGLVGLQKFVLVLIWGPISHIRGCLMATKSPRLLFVFMVLAISAVFVLSVSPVLAQTSSTGALTGTVTDPSGAVIAGAGVAAIDAGTGAERDTTTNSSGSYKIALLPPGTYNIRFTATGFKTVEIPAIKVNVTETAVLNRRMEIGSSVSQVTVEATAETLQTENATNGGLVSGSEIQTLPLVTRNYTQVLSLSPGVVTNVSNAAAVGNGTQDVNANGARVNQNNYSMDGASIVGYGSGNGGQVGNFPGIPIPNPEAIQEFKVQTSQYDASYGRNPGANVDVVTKGGSNNFHGDAWEFNRNNLFNANDFFYKRSEMSNGQANKPQVLKQNTFGGDLGGYIIKNKLFFYGNYQGFRQINGIGTSGFANGYQAAVPLLPFNDYNYQTDGFGCTDLRCTNNPAGYKQYLGSVFGPTGPCGEGPGFFFFTAPLNNCNIGFADGVTVAADGSNISNTAVAVLQAKGAYNGKYDPYNVGGFYIPSSLQGCKLKNPSGPSSGCTTAISLPQRANEDQFMANSDWIISPKNTLSERYLYQRDPQLQSFLSLFFPNSSMPGSPETVKFNDHTGTLKLTSILTGNLVNEARFTFWRNQASFQDPNTVTACGLPNGASIIPLINNGQPCPAVAFPYAEAKVIPIIDVLGIFGQSGGTGIGGNFASTTMNVQNTFQAGDQVSWNRGKQSLRLGFDGEWDQFNNNIPASTRGELIFDNWGDFLTSSAGMAIDGTAPTGPAANGGVPTLGCGVFGVSYCAGGAAAAALRGLLTHYNRIKAFSLFIQDDIKVNRKLTVNAGLRWEYGAWPSDKIGQFTNVWASQLALVDSGSYFLNGATDICPSTGNPLGTLAGFVVPKNFDRAAGFTNPCGATGVFLNSNDTVFSGVPLDNFAPRVGLAWQPLGNKFVVRAGYGWFRDRFYSTWLVDNLLNLPPYSDTVTGVFPASLTNTLHEPYASVAGSPLTWQPRYLYVGGNGDINSTGGSVLYSALGYTSNSNDLSRVAPLTQEYGLDLQYEFAPGWVADVGYQGMHAIHIFNTGYNVNKAHLVDCGAPSTACNAPTEPQDVAMLVSAAHPLTLPGTGITQPYIPFNDPGNTAPILYNTTENLAARVSYLGYTAGAYTTNALGDALYNSLQVQVRHNFSHGLLLQAAYTWSKELTDVNQSVAGGGFPPGPPGQVLAGSSNSNNSFDLRQQYGPAAFNRSQRLIVTYSYDLPYRKTEGFAGHLLSGWSISGITTVQNGEPFTVTDSGGDSIYGVGESRALLANPVRCGSNGVCQSGTPVASLGSTKQRALNGWINTAAFTGFSTLKASSPYCVGGVYNPGGSASAACGSAGATYPGAGTGWGNSPVGVLTGPGQWNTDLSLQKNTKVTEWGTLQFRAEFFNVWNHAQFDNPSSVEITSATFGQIQTTVVAPRVIQFGLKFMF